MKRHVSSALEALSSVVPSTLAAVVWLGHKVGPSMIPSMILAVVCGIVVTNVIGSFSRRPLVYVARFFEVSLLVGFLESFIAKLSHWGLADSAELRLTWVFVICLFAALMQVVFYTLKLQRLMRYIPAPVFAGFLNAVALVLVIGQARTIYQLIQANNALLSNSLFVAGLALVVALLVKRFQPKLPAGMLGLVTASAAAFALSLFSSGLPSVVTGPTQWVLPIQLLDSSLLSVAPKFLVEIGAEIAFSGLLLAMVVFLNTVLASEVISQSDDRPEPTPGDVLRLSASQVIGACLGSAPISGAPAASLAAMRDDDGLEPTAIRLFCAFLLICFGLNLVTWLPSAAMIGLLLFEASCLYDRSSAVALKNYLFSSDARRSMSIYQRDDLLCVAVVTATSVLFNMVVALIVGIALALMLFAKRNGKATIRDVRSASRIRSNVARSPLESQCLAAQGERIKCVSLQGALYFGSAGSLRAELTALLANTSWIVLNWQHVTLQDSTLNQMLGLFERKAHSLGVLVVHASRAGHPSSFPDLDRALEYCENQLIAQHAPAPEHRALTPPQELPREAREGIFFSGFNSAALAILATWFEVRHYKPGDVLLAVGEMKRDMHLIVEGRVDVLIGGGKIRAASVRAGAVLGEANFLVGVRRAADAVALDRVTTHVLSYERFQSLSAIHPEISQQLMLNLCTELVNRSRSLQMQVERERQ